MKFRYCKFSSHPKGDKCKLYGYEGQDCFHIFCKNYTPDSEKEVEI